WLDVSRCGGILRLRAAAPTLAQRRRTVGGFSGIRCCPDRAVHPTFRQCAARTAPKPACLFAGGGSEWGVGSLLPVPQSGNARVGAKDGGVIPVHLLRFIG